MNDDSTLSALSCGSWWQGTFIQEPARRIKFGQNPTPAPISIEQNVL